MEDLVAFPDAKLRKPLSSWASRKADDPAAVTLQDISNPEFVSRSATFAPAFAMLQFIVETTRCAMQCNCIYLTFVMPLFVQSCR